MVKTINITNQVGDLLESKGFGSDSNESLDITQAGVWDILDAVNGIDNSKFSKEDAIKGAKRMDL